MNHQTETKRVTCRVSLKLPRSYLIAPLKTHDQSDAVVCYILSVTSVVLSPSSADCDLVSRLFCTAKALGYQSKLRRRPPLSGVRFDSAGSAVFDPPDSAGEYAALELIGRLIGVRGGAMSCSRGAGFWQSNVPLQL